LRAHNLSKKDGIKDSIFFSFTGFSCSLRSRPENPAENENKFSSVSANELPKPERNHTFCELSLLFFCNPLFHTAMSL